MVLTRRTFFVLLIVGLVWTSLAQVPPPDTGKMSWDLFQTVESGQRKRAIGGEVETVSALLMTDSPATDDNLSALRELGYTILGAYGHFVLVQAPADYYGDPEKGLDVINFVCNATLPPTAMPSSNTGITNGCSAIGASEAWNLGYRGQNTKIAVIDTGFDSGNESLSQMNPTLYKITPSADKVGSYRSDEGETAQSSVHGTSCAIIAGDVAPDTEFYLLNYPDNNILLGWLCALDFAVCKLKVDVISTSIEFTRSYCHADGTGPLNGAVSGILKNTDTTLVIAAGNWAAGSGADRSFYGADFSDADGDFRHDFTPNATNAWDRNTLRFSAQKGDTVTIMLEWDNWDEDIRTKDLDLYLYDDEYRTLVGQSRAQQLGSTNNPEEVMRVEIPATGSYCLRVENRAAKAQASKPVNFHLYLIDQTHPIGFIEHHTACGSVRGVATNPDAISVGAISVDGGKLRTYSSRGPNNGPKPAFCAPDGVSGTAYQTFIGTSAAAPYVAGAISLMRSAKTDASMTDILAVLRKTATRSSDTCGNPVYKIDVLKAIQELIKD